MKLRKTNKNLECELATEKYERGEMTTKFIGLRNATNDLDSSSFESLKKKFDETNNKITSLELENSKLVDELNESIKLVKSMYPEIQKLNSDILNLKAENDKIKSELSTLKKQKEIDCSTTSVSPRCV